MNTTFIMSLIKKYANNAKEISQDDFLELVEGLEEEEIETVLAIITSNGYRVVDEAVNKTFYYVAGNLTGLTNEELCVMAQSGSKEAADALIINNDRLVHKIAERVLKQYKPTSLDEEDLFIEGCLGFMKAIEKFDVSMGNKLSTYACFWIRQAITRAVMDQGFGVRLPVHMFEQVILVNKCRKLHPEASMTELHYFVNNDFGKDYSFQEIQDLLMYGDKYLNTTSLNKVINDSEGGDTEIMDFIPSEESVEDQVIETLISEEIINMLNTLSEREHAVISMRFGLEGNNKMTLEEIGAIYNVTRERIRQIENKAIKKLSHPSRRKRLEGLYA